MNPIDNRLLFEVFDENRLVCLAVQCGLYKKYFSFIISLLILYDVFDINPPTCMLTILMSGGPQVT